MTQPDRILLYAMIRALRPTTVLEIGVRYGNGARIIASALADNDHGQAVGIDPSTEVFVAPRRHLHGRYYLHAGYSPEAIPTAVERLGGYIDLVLIDALHTGDAVYGDFAGFLPYLANGAHVFFHDAYHQGIASAIDQIAAENPDFLDLGMLSRHPDVNQPVSYQGLRVLRKGRITDAKTHILNAYLAAGQRPPPFHEVFRNYDEFANRIGKGADIEDVERVLTNAKARTSREALALDPTEPS